MNLAFSPNKKWVAIANFDNADFDDSHWGDSGVPVLEVLTDHQMMLLESGLIGLGVTCTEEEAYGTHMNVYMLGGD